MSWEPPRCSHGHILLACPDDDCPEQSAYLAEQRAAWDHHCEAQRLAARKYVRSLLGLPLESPPGSPDV